MNPVATSGVQAELQMLLAAAAAGSGRAVLAQARSVAERLRPAPPVEPAESGWLALHGTDDAFSEEVLCWLEGGGLDASLQAAWSGGILKRLDVMVGGQAWGVLPTSAGELEITAGDEWEDAPVMAALHADQEHRWADGRRRAREEIDRVGGWRCGGCAWYNEEGAPACERCAAPSTAPPPLPPGESLPGRPSSLGGGLAAGAGALVGGADLLRRMASAVPRKASPPEMRPCPSCQGAVLKAARACPHCRAVLPPQCSGCGRTCAPNARFCDQCGTRLPE